MARASYRDDISSHPDVSEMRDRYSRMVGRRDVALVDAPVLLLGLYIAVSPWVVHFSGSHPALWPHNLVIGIATALMAIGFTAAPGRMYGLSWAMCALGLWMIVSPWVVGRWPDGGVITNQIITGALLLIMGLVCAGTAARSSSARQT